MIAPRPVFQTIPCQDRHKPAILIKFGCQIIQMRPERVSNLKIIALMTGNIRNALCGLQNIHAQCRQRRWFPRSGRAYRSRNGQLMPASGGSPVGLRWQPQHGSSKAPALRATSLATLNPSMTVQSCLCKIDDFRSGFLIGRVDLVHRTPSDG